MSSLSVRRVGYALGAEVTGVDCSKPIDDATVAQIRTAWLEHHVLCFPGQALSPSEMLSFCGRFGMVDDNRPGNPAAQHPEIREVLMLANVPGQLKADYWHTDRSFTDRPATATILNALTLPDIGGDTMFTNLEMAYETLSPAMKRVLDPLECVYDYTLHPMYLLRSPEKRAEVVKMYPPVIHPLVRAHDETGKKSIYIDKLLRNFCGMTVEETKPLLDFLFEHAVRYEFIYRHNWRVSDLVMWDNRATLHYAVGDFDPHQSRRMQRITLLGAKTGKLETPELATAAN